MQRFTFMAVISYLRVSTTGQTVANQRQAIRAAGWTVGKEFADEAVSGTSEAASRTGWDACFSYLRDGDTLVVYALDRLGRSTLDVLLTIQAVADKGVRLVILKQGFDTDTPAGKLALTMFAAFAEFEHGIRKERQKEGIARARGEGRYHGRKPKLAEDRQAELAARWHAGENHSGLAAEYGVDRTTAFRIAKRLPPIPSRSGSR
jgi:putative DNA-invertase from lambdoid prophage Rac